MEMEQGLEEGMAHFLKRLWTDQRGQDFIEYALLAAALVIVVAGFLPQDIMPSVSSIFSKISSTMAIS
jgi:Flp pilus assembly pilin Flp